jgi:endonuclease-3
MARTGTSRRRTRGPRALPGARERAAGVVDRLRAEYPAAECALHHRNPWELLVATILSAQCTDERVNLTTPALFRRWPTPAAMAGAVLEEVEEVVRPTGFFHMKALAITTMSQDVVLKHGGEIPRTMEELVELRGVGRKTANVVLGVAYGIPGLPVDTHVTRLSRRLRLARPGNAESIEAELCALVPAAEWTELGLRLILHGRRICDARRPLCQRCVLADICPSAGMAVRPPKGRRRAA